MEQIVESPFFPDPEDRAHARPIELRVVVSEVFKGAAPARIVIDENLYDRYLRAEGSTPGEFRWPEPAGVCFGLSGDPTGEEFVMGLRPVGAGHYELVIGPGAFSSSLYGRAPGDPRPPATGNTDTEVTHSDASNDWMFISAIGAGFLLLTLVLLLAGPRREKRRRE
jgi:hypothetical protein